MSLNILLFVATFILVINQGSTLKCYLCVGSTQSDCSRGNKNSMIIETCPNRTEEQAYHNYLPNMENEVDAPIITSCVSFKGAMRDMTMYERSCTVAYKDTDICDIIRKKIKVTYCKSCSKDLCNL